MTMDLPNFHTPSAHPTTITTSTLDIMDVKPLGPGGRQQPKGFLAFANGTPRWTPTPPPPSETTTTQQSVVVSYKECLRNHAANIGGHALDGCCEFMPSPSFTPSDPTSLKCAACGCHRNFHRRDPDDPNPIHHHHSSLSFPLLPREPSPPPPPPQPPQQDNNNNNNNNNNTSPAAAYFSSALLALSQSPGSGATTTADDENLMAGSGTGGGHRNYNSLSGRKRFRTKFSQEQKDKMYEFSEKVGWRLKKDDEGLIEDFCNEVGVGRTVLKVWMHNNKNTFGNRQNNNNYGGSDILNGNSVTGGFSLGNGVFHSGNGNSNGAVKKVGTACGGLGSNGHQLKQELHRNGQEFSEDGNCENFQGVSSNGSGSSSSG